MGNINELAHLVDEVCQAAVEPNIAAFKDSAFSYITEKKNQYRGTEYIDQLLKNIIYSLEMADIEKFETVNLLVKGKQGAESIQDRINLFKSVALERVPFQKKYVEMGCSGCKYHDEHLPYEFLKDLHDLGGDNYVTELEKLMLGIKVYTQIVGVLFITLYENCDRFGKFQASFQLIDEVLQSRMNLHTLLAIGDRSDYVKKVSDNTLERKGQLFKTVISISIRSE